MRSSFWVSVPLLLIVLLTTAGCTSTTTTSSIITPAATAIVTTSAPASGTTAMASTTVPGAGRTGTGQTVQLAIIAKNYAFDQSSLSVPAGSRVQLTFDNQDMDVPHNVAIYTTAAASTVIYNGEIITGSKQITYTFDAPTTPGTYYFRCDVHPSMNGKSIVQ